jgi:hypothetical protein
VTATPTPSIKSVFLLDRCWHCVGVVLVLSCLCVGTDLMLASSAGMTVSYASETSTSSTAPTMTPNAKVGIVLKLSCKKLYGQERRLSLTVFNYTAKWLLAKSWSLGFTNGSNSVACLSDTYEVGIRPDETRNFGQSCAEPSGVRVRAFATFLAYDGQQFTSYATCK